MPIARPALRGAEGRGVLPPGGPPRTGLPPAGAGNEEAPTRQHTDGAMNGNKQHLHLLIQQTVEELRFIRHNSCETMRLHLLWNTFKVWGARAFRPWL